MKHKRRIIKLFILLAFAACIAPFFINDKYGNPLLSVDKIQFPSIDWSKVSLFSSKDDNTKNLSPQIKDGVADSSDRASDQNTVIIYTYKDEMGVSHYTNKRPDGIDYEVIHMPAGQQDEKVLLTKIKEKIDDIYQKVTQEKVSESHSPEQKSKDESLRQNSLGPNNLINQAKEIQEKLAENYQKKEDALK